MKMEKEAKRTLEIIANIPDRDKIKGVETKYFIDVVEYGCQALLRLGEDFKTPIHKWLMDFREEKFNWNSPPPTGVDYYEIDDVFVSWVINRFYRTVAPGQLLDRLLLEWIYRNIVFCAEKGSIGYNWFSRRDEYVTSLNSVSFYMSGSWTFKFMKCNQFENGKPRQPIKI